MHKFHWKHAFPSYRMHAIHETCMAFMRHSCNVHGHSLKKHEAPMAFMRLFHETCMAFMVHACHSWGRQGIHETCMAFMRHAWHSRCMHGIHEVLMAYMRHACMPQMGHARTSPCRHTHQVCLSVLYASFIWACSCPLVVLTRLFGDIGGGTGQHQVPRAISIVTFWKLGMFKCWRMAPV